MAKEKILKTLLIILGVIMISATGYEIWKMNKDIEKIAKVEPQTVLPKEVLPQTAPPKKAEAGEIDTSNWKTYRNEKYGFELKYPPNLMAGSRFNCIVGIDEVYKNWPYRGPYISICSPEAPPYRPPLTVDLVQWIKENYREFYESPEFKEIPNNPNIKIGGLIGVKLEAVDTNSFWIFVKKDQKLIVIILSNADIEKNKKLYDQILSTFRFF